MTHHDIRPFALPIAVAAAGAFIGVGIYLGARHIADSGIVATGSPAAIAKAAETAPKKPAPISSQDHVRGNSKAKVVIYEYSDLECPFCKSFHSTLKQVTSKYSGADVAWVYRHLPLAIHDRALKEAEASECAAEQGGHASFWSYVDRIFEITPGNNRLDPSELSKTAAHIGLNVPDFEKCLSSGKYATKVQAQANEGRSIGVTGTPHTVIIGPDGSMSVLKGASNVATVTEKIESALGKK